MTGENAKREAVRERHNLFRKLQAEGTRFEPTAVAEYLTRFAMALALALTEIFGTYRPLALALVAASGVGLRGGITLLGAATGYLLCGSYPVALKYITASFLVFAVNSVMRTSKAAEKPWFAPASASLFVLCGGLVFDLGRGWDFSAATMMATEVAITAVSCRCYSVALSPWFSGNSAFRSEEYRHSVSVAVLLVSVASAFIGLRLFGMISVGRFLLVVAVFAISFKGGPALGCTCGLLIGLLADAASGTMPYFCLAYSFSGLSAGIFCRYGKVHFASAFILADCAACIWMWKSHPDAAILYEVFIASVVFLLIPNKQMAKLGSFFPGVGASYGAARFRRYTSDKVEKAAEAFSDLYATVRTASGGDRNDNDVATIFDRSAEVCCRDCEKSSDCWQEHYETTLDALNHLVPSMMEAGSIGVQDLPEHFQEICVRPDALTASINEELRSLLYRRQYRSRLQEKLSAAYNQYADISRVLSGIARELDCDAVSDPAAERKLQKYLRSLDIDASTAVFRDGNNRLHLEITSTSLSLLTRDSAYLDKLSTVVGTRLCSSGYKYGSGRLILLEAEPYSVTVGVAAIRKSGQTISGDRGTYFKTDEGVLYILLSDGMGTGEFAAKCSSDTIKILERFLRAGVAPEISLQILNSLTLLRSESDLSSATVDLMEINLFTGEAQLFKYGAAPTYIRRGQSLKRIKGKSFSVGLGEAQNTAPDAAELKLLPADCVIMLSDGAVSGGCDDWIAPVLDAHRGEPAKDVSKALLETATGKFGTDDDMTILTILFDERK